MKTTIHAFLGAGLLLAAAGAEAVKVAADMDSVQVKTAGKTCEPPAGAAGTDGDAGKEGESHGETGGIPGGVPGVESNIPGYQAVVGGNLACRAERAFTDTFPVEFKDLSTTGRNPYFILEPGYQLVLEGGGKKKEVLTVTVLADTKEVGGVKTRVVEERETEDGKVTEVSRNYFAICRRTNSVYYFGEDAGGAWAHGERGARFGLMIPGVPLLGARYYQEIAPEVAMDRAEIVGTAETLATPAGTFTNCLKVEETTPLEPEAKDYKIYAPGIGLIQDGRLKLVRYGKAAR